MEFAAFAFFAILIERVIEYFIKPRVPGKAIVFVALAFGLLISFGYQLDLIAALGIVPAAGWLGYTLTGVVLAGGSNFLNDIIGKVRANKAEAS